jgi:two-component system OmpR family response regulator
MKILVIEDDAETAAYIANGLKEHGHTTDLAATGDGSFEAA